jgi:VWFA-related protein
MKRLSVLLFGLGVVGSWQLDARTLFQRPQFRAGTQVVSVDVSVRNRKAAVAGLSAADFALTDNGVTQTCELVAIADVPLDVTLVLDESSGAALKMAEHFPDDLRRISTELRSIDRLQILTAATLVREVVPMLPPTELLKPNAITSLNVSGALDHQSIWDLDHDPSRRLSTQDALFIALARPTEVGRRHLVVVFTVGTDAAGSFGSILDRGALAPIAERADALLHVVLEPPRIGKSGTRTFVVGGATADAPRLPLIAAAQATGGDVHNSNDGVDAFKRILADFRERYILQYEVVGVPTAGWHAIQVKTPKCPSCDVQARKGYVGR